jgi:hypothetical protein
VATGDQGTPGCTETPVRVTVQPVSLPAGLSIMWAALRPRHQGRVDHALHPLSGGQVMTRDANMCMKRLPRKEQVSSSSVSCALPSSCASSRQMSDFSPARQRRIIRRG